MNDTEVCPECGREVHVFVDVKNNILRLVTHTNPDDRYGPACPRQFPALPHRHPRRHW